MNKLNEIISNKIKEISSNKELYPQKLLESSIHFQAPTVSLKKYLLRQDLNGIIAEIKRKSPSRGVLHHNVSIEEIAIEYMQAGASALSILTDKNYFGGSNEDLKTARKINFCPILRKDFIVDEYQIIESRSIGADAILLIAAVLNIKEIKAFAKLAKSLGLEVIMEVHTREELERNLIPEIDIVGVNNRNLKDFSVQVDTSFALADSIPKECIKISESGISEVKTILELQKAGFQGFLIGETFMKTSRPGKTCAEFVEKLRNGKKTRS